MKSRSGKEIEIIDVDLEIFDNGFKLLWDSNIGFGEMIFIKEDDEYEVETECMSTNEDKRFIKLVLDKFIDKLEVVE